MEKIFTKITEVVNGGVSFFVVIMFQQLSLLPLMLSTHVKNVIGLILLTVITVGLQSIIVSFVFKKIKISDVPLAALQKKSLVSTWFSLILVMVVIQIMTTEMQAHGFFQSNANQQIIENLLATNLIGGALVVTITGPIVEELIFRGLFFDKWSDIFDMSGPSQMIGVFMSSFVFAFMHTLNFSIGLLPYFLTGVALAIAYLRTKNIVVPIVAHMALNILAFII